MIRMEAIYLHFKNSPWPWTVRQRKWDPPSPLDRFLASPLRMTIFYLHALLTQLRGSPTVPPRDKPAIKIVCLSDTHCDQVDVPHGDLLIHAGDMGQVGSAEEIQAQIDWLDEQPHAEKILVAGNHDSWFDKGARLKKDRESGAEVDLKSVKYLENESITLRFRGGRELTIYGAPDIIECGPRSFAFQYKQSNPPWRDRIPQGTDVVVTHSPAFGHCDVQLGCPSLLQELWRARPRLHVHGHIHSGHGREYLFWDEGQRAYERLLASTPQGIWADLLPSAAWLDAIRVLWFDVQGIAWRLLMAGPGHGGGTLTVNAALRSEITKKPSHRVQVVEL